MIPNAWPSHPAVLNNYPVHVPAAPRANAEDELYAILFGQEEQEEQSAVPQDLSHGFSAEEFDFLLHQPITPINSSVPSVVHDHTAPLAVPALAALGPSPRTHMHYADAVGQPMLPQPQLYRRFDPMAMSEHHPHMLLRSFAQSTDHRSSASPIPNNHPYSHPGSSSSSLSAITTSASGSRSGSRSSLSVERGRYPSSWAYWDKNKLREAECTIGRIAVLNGNLTVMSNWSTLGGSDAMLLLERAIEIYKSNNPKKRAPSESVNNYIHYTILILTHYFRIFRG